MLFGCIYAPITSIFSVWQYWYIWFRRERKQL